MMLRPTRPEETEKTRTSPGMKKDAEKKRSVIPLLLGAALLTGGGAAYFALRNPAPAAQAAPVAPPVPSPAATAAPRFTMRIESAPPGADVREGDRVLGATPFELPIENDGVRSAPRVFTLVKEGFIPYMITQGPSSDPLVRVVAQLVSVPAPAVSSAAPRAPSPPTVHRGGHAPPQATTTAAPSSKPDLDIRMNR